MPYTRNTAASLSAAGRPFVSIKSTVSPCEDYKLDDGVYGALVLHSAAYLITYYSGSHLQLSS